MSSLKINLAKSELVLVGNVNNVDGMANILSCKVSSLHMKYLGLPLGAPPKAKSIWDGFIEKIKRCLASWKMMNLFKGRRITLMKSILSNLPTYFMSLFPLHAEVANHKTSYKVGVRRKFQLSCGKAGLRFVLPFLREGWGSKTCFCSSMLL